MRYFEKLVAETNDYRLSIVEDIPKNGLVLIVRKKNSIEYIPAIFEDTVQACKGHAAKKYGVSMDAWRSEGKYFESLVATNNKGDTFRIKGDLPGVGFYLHAFDKDGENIVDDLGGFSDLQDTIQACKSVASEVSGVPLDAWREE